MSIKNWRVQPSRKSNVLVVYDDMIPNVISGKNLQVVTELIIRGRKVNILQFLSDKLIFQ